MFGGHGYVLVIVIVLVAARLVYGLARSRRK